MLSKVLSSPLVFNLQQKLFNSYGNVKTEFSDYFRDESLSILDLGCSTGIAGQAICDITKQKYIGIDIDQKYINFAKKTCPGVDYRVMDGRKLEFSDHFFDIVMFVGVLHHMDDQTAQACIKEVRRTLKPDGVLLIAEPVFTPNSLISNLFLSIDRGQHIRESSDYLKLVMDFELVRRRYFRLSLHRFISVVAR
jgi:SAM-dependent methyltransferase